MSATPPPDWHDWMARSEARSRQAQVALLHDLAADVAEGRAQMVSAEATQNTHIPHDPVLLTLQFAVPPHQEDEPLRRASS